MALTETRHSPQFSMVSRPLLFQLSLGYLLFIVYGSLLPFELNNLSFSAALANFRHIPLLDLGAESRADLVANLLLYIPFGLLLCGGIAGANPRPLPLVMGIVVTLLVAVAIALGIEFTQQFFAPRTVSLNDIFAELAGSVLGIALWPVTGARLVQLVRGISRGGANARYPALIAYALLFAVLSIFPYDFLLSYDELRAKLVSENVGLIFTPDCGGRCMLRLIPEALLVTPLAILFFSPVRKKNAFLLAAVTGAALGALIEGLQLTIASGISQGASIGSRALGMMLGVGLMQIAPGMNWRSVRHYVRPMLLLAVLPYLAGITWANGWFSSAWADSSTAWLKLKDTNLLPFYYHYFTTETAALISLLFQAALYFPVGVGLWLWHWGSRRTSEVSGAGETAGLERDNASPALIAGMLAIIIEAGKLFIPSQHPDPTNVLIAIASATIASRLLYLIFNAERASPIVHAEPTPTFARHIRPVQDDVEGRPILAGIVGIAAITLAIPAALSTPLPMVWILPALAAYAVLLWWRPGLWLVYVPGLLPLLDLTPRSGRLFWTEFDTVLLITIGIGYLHLRSRSKPHRTLRRPAQILLALFALSAAISLGIGLLPLVPIDQNAFANYTSPYNALRVAKGLLFAIAFIPLLSFEWNDSARAERRLASGMTLGLAGAVAYVLWERATFPGIFNFETDYRITGPFPGMHVGGAYIEAFLTAALPFVALFAWHRQRLWATVWAAGLYGLGAYSVMVTFSRGGQAAFALSTLVLLIGFAGLSLRRRMRSFSKVGAVIAIAGVAMVVTWPVFSGKYSQSRWAATAQDFSSRTAHWADALGIVRAQNASLFGLGLGGFPSAYYWNSSAPSRTATYAFVTEQGNSMLRLGSGDPLYFEQLVPAVPEQKYTLSMDLRAGARNTGLIVTLCEKAVLYSYTCATAPFQVSGPVGKWTHHEAHLDTRGFGPLGSQFERPVKLSLYNTAAGTVVDVDNVMLRDSRGENLVRNGDFSGGMNYWFFSTDNYLPWHVENLYLNVYVEQGWFGVILFLALIGYAIARWLPRALHGDPLSLVLCSSLVAFLVVGALNSWADEPRLGFLFYLVLIAGLIAEARSVLPGYDPAVRESK